MMFNYLSHQKTCQTVDTFFWLNCEIKARYRKGKRISDVHQNLNTENLVAYFEV